MKIINAQRIKHFIFSGAIVLAVFNEIIRDSFLQKKQANMQMNFTSSVIRLFQG